MRNFSLQKLWAGLMFISLMTSLSIGQAYAEKLSTAKTLQSTKDIVSIQNAWVRPTNAGQEVGAAYMTLTSTQDVTLVGIESNITKSVEIHSMSMEGGVMKMRMLDTLPLTAGKPYKLAPGGFHLMLFDLKKPLNVGDQVDFVLHFKASKNNKASKSNVEFKQNISATVQSSADANGTAK